MVRGVQLVEDVLQRCDIEPAAPPLSADTVATMRFPNGARLPASLQRWLQFDGHLFAGFGRVQELPRQSLATMMTAEFDPFIGDVWGGSFEAMLPGDCYALPSGADSRCFLYAGVADELGELPVFLVDTDDTPFVTLECPGFDVYLAQLFGTLTVNRESEHRYGALFDDSGWSSAMVNQARLNFHGLKFVDLGGEIEHVDGPESLAAVMQQFTLEPEDQA